MKLNYRDKVVLIVLAVLLVLIAGIMLFVKPAIDDCNTASDQLEAKKVELAELKEKNNKDANLKNDIKKLKSDIKVKTDNFYGYQISYKALETVRGLFDDEEVQIQPSSMSISAYGSTLLTPYLYTSGLTLTEIDESIEEYERLAAQEKNKGKKTEENTTTVAADAETIADPSFSAIGCYDITCEFKSSYEGFKKFTQNLTTNSEKSMVLKDVTINDVAGIKEKDIQHTGEGTELTDEEKEDVGKIEGSFTLQMIVLRKISE